MAITPLTSTPNATTNAKLLDERAAVAESEQIANATKAAANTKAESDSATFSTRAERLAALNKEFTITGPNFEVSAAFISRLQEFEFISPGEAEGLLGQSVTSDHRPATGSDNPVPKGPRRGQAGIASSRTSQ